MTLPNLILGIVSLSQNGSVYGWLFIVLAGLGIIATLWVWAQLIGQYASDTFRVVSIKRFNFDMFSHIVSYLPSLLAFGIGNGVELHALFSFYIFYIFIVSMSDIVVLNPLLYIFGWRFRGAVLNFDKGTEEVVIITKPGDTLILGEAQLKELSEFGMYLLDE